MKWHPSAIFLTHGFYIAFSRKYSSRFDNVFLFARTKTRPIAPGFLYEEQKERVMGIFCTPIHGQMYGFPSSMVILERLSQDGLFFTRKEI
jgi:hypothetical protein